MLNNSFLWDNPIFTVSFVGIATSLYAFCSQRKHLISTLLSLEGAVLALFILISSYSAFNGNNTSFIMTFITLAVCEAALGLMVLVIMVRSHSNDYLNSMSMI